LDGRMFYLNVQPAEGQYNP